MSKAKVLIVEDESIVALDMKRTLERFDFHVTDTAICCDEAIDSINSEEPDVILMDINLNSSKDGIETTKQIQEKSKIPVIYLTAFSDESTINRAIKTEPIAYLVKPFKKEDLKSNILLALYKSKKVPEFYSKINYMGLGGNYYYDYDNRKLFFMAYQIKLTKKEDLLLRLLIDAEGKLVTFETLEKKIWPNIVVSDSTLRTLIYRLRMKMDYNLIESTPMLGCRLSDFKVF